MYQAFYKLTGKPFRLSPDPAFFFPSRGHKRALAYLRYGLNQDEGFVVITGAPGTGKTTLAKILLQEMDAGVVVAHLTTTQLEADDMLRMVAASFGLRYEGLDKAGLLKSLENFLLARSRERKRALLVIDEAQNLPSRSLEELRMLSNLQIGDKALLQIFLLGQEQFRNMLDNPGLEQLRQRVIANYHLTPLAADECQRYIESRLQHVAWNNDPHFAEVAHELIHRYTDGIPRRINMLCDRIMLYGCMEETHEITGEVVNLVKREMDEEISGKSLDQVNAEFDDPLEEELRIQAYKANKQETSSAAQSTSTKQQSPLQNALNKTAAEIESAKPQFSKSEAANSQPGKPGVIKPGMAKPEVAGQAAQPAATAQPKKYELLKSKTDESEKLGIMSTSFDNTEVEDDLEELDIDYALFADKADDDFGENEFTNRQFANREYGKKEYTGKKEAPAAESKSARKPADISETTAKDTKVEEQNARYSFAKLEEKLAKKTPSAESRNPPLPKSEQPSAAADKQVMGNTVQKTKPETVKTEEGDSAKPSEISERDLFRVIPGGKSFGKIPGLGESEQPSIAASAKSEPTSSDVKLRRILRLVLAFHRSPSRFPGLDSPMQPLPEGITELLELAISDDQVLNQVSPAAVMGISPVMLRAAVRFFVRRALFTPEGDHYRCLGLQPGASQAQIEKHYDLLMRLLRQDKQRGSADSVERVGQAYEALNRGEQGPSADSKAAAVKEEKAVFDDAVVFDNDNEKDGAELIIDFDEVEKNPPRAAPSTFVAKPNERFNPVPNTGVSRKTVRYASQLAVLGFGALVIVLGLYIVQLEPSSTSSQPKVTAPPKNTLGNEVAAITEKPSSSSSLVSSAATNTLNAEANATDSLASAAQRRNEVDDVEAMRKELLAHQATDDTTPNYESPLNSTLDSNSDSEPAAAVDDILSNAKPSVNEETAKPEMVVPRTSVSEKPKPALAQSKPTQQATPAPRVSTPPVELAENSVEITPPKATDSQSQPTPSNRFEGRDIELAESKPRRSETFSSIAARTPTPRIDPVKPAPSATVSPPTANAAPAQPAVTPAPSAPAAQVASTVEPTPLEDVKPKAASTITKSQLTSLVNNFVASYEAGNVDKVMDLFASDARTNNRTNAKEIQSDYVELFKSTTARKMTISALNWNIENDYARGSGDYRAQINPVGTQGSQTFSGNITIQVQQDPAGLKISRFYFSNQSVSTGPRMPESTPAGQAPNAVASAAPDAPAPAAAPSVVASNKPAVAAASFTITAQDLQNLVDEFAQSYANGNLNGLMDLFADDAKTNDQSSAAGIRKDYADLFQGSARRQMIISNMKWTLTKDRANGEGPFEVNVQAKGGNKVTTVKGTLKMIVVKGAKGAKIVEMVHAIK